VRFDNIWLVEVLQDEFRNVFELKKIALEKMSLALKDYDVAGVYLRGPDGKKLEEDLPFNKLPESSRENPLKLDIVGRYTGSFFYIWY
jgi:hypothetical protein